MENPFEKKLFEKNEPKENAASERDIEKLLKMPNIESKYQLSKDGRFLIHRTIITDIKPMSYMEKVVSNDKK